MKDSVSPKQAARAINVSESSVKRWCDKGAIEAHYTNGGHRRIPIQALLDFLRETGRPLLEPEAVGLVGAPPRFQGSRGEPAALVRDALLSGDEDTCRRVLLSLYYDADYTIGRLADEVISPVFEEIGAKWECGDAEVYQERHACEICSRALQHLRDLQGDPPTDAPRAIGGTLEGDQYQLASTLVELVLREVGWRADSLGANLPYDTLAAAIEEEKPTLFWISVSYVHDRRRLIDGVNRLYDLYGGRVSFLVGGRELDAELRREIQFECYCDNLEQLRRYAASLLKPRS